MAVTAKDKHMPARRRPTRSGPGPKGVRTNAPSGSSRATTLFPAPARYAKSRKATIHDGTRPCPRLPDCPGTGWGGRIRTYGTRYQKPLPYHLATPQLPRCLPKRLAPRKRAQGKNCAARNGSRAAAVRQGESDDHAPEPARQAAQASGVSRSIRARRSARRTRSGLLDARMERPPSSPRRLRRRGSNRAGNSTG